MCAPKLPDPPPVTANEYADPEMVRKFWLPAPADMMSTRDVPRNTTVWVASVPFHCFGIGYSFAIEPRPDFARTMMRASLTPPADTSVQMMRAGLGEQPKKLLA